MYIVYSEIQPRIITAKTYREALNKAILFINCDFPNVQIFRAYTRVEKTSCGHKETFIQHSREECVTTGQEHKNESIAKAKQILTKG